LGIEDPALADQRRGHGVSETVQGGIRHSSVDADLIEPVAQDLGTESSLVREVSSEQPRPQVKSRLVV
jgi:hypothetical protein